MDMHEVSRFEQKVGTLKLSETVREAGYIDPWDYHQCALGCAYRHRTGRDLPTDAVRGAANCLIFAARYFKIPMPVARAVENQCIRGDTREQIADWLEAQGL
jgi:hypothetical protein